MQEAQLSKPGTSASGHSVSAQQKYFCGQTFPSISIHSIISLKVHMLVLENLLCSVLLHFFCQVTSGFDICNGMFYNSNGDYAYFATQTFPYMTGCFGPGNYPNVSVNCSSNAPSSYTKSKYAGHAVSTFSSETLVLVYTITFLMTMVTLKQ
ncbi:unnamed protein product [Rotaria socialis]|uniref:Uncharacterized protein n=1 Tax=Rotaria socialis TaxID=392032 RepID=A0A818L489_9BILA|nr:unnamed protein product [Rotaria socialis]CAF4490860.1 unnamed protein product [Rotaria socialis]